MCGRYTLRRPGLLNKLNYQSTFEEFDEIKITPRFNIAPSQSIIAIRNNKAGLPSLTPVRWGLIPSWQPSLPKAQPINARAESVATSGMYRQAFARRRCLIPADGFYEWQTKEDGVKRPHFIRRADDDVFYFAGIWERWHDPATGATIDTAALITTTPSEVMRPVHNRMPVILADEDIAAWMHSDTPADQLLSLLKPYNGALSASEVGTRVNSPRNDSPENIEPPPANTELPA